MSMSHKASNLALHNRVCSIPEGGILFPFDSGLHGVDSAGNIVQPLDGAVATLRPGEGRFGGGAVAVEEGTTNLWGNIDNLGIADRNGTLSKEDYHETFNGSKVVKITKISGTPSNHASFRRCITTTPDVSYTISWKLKVIEGSINSIGRHFRGCTGSSVNSYPLKDGWYQFYYTSSNSSETILCSGVGFIGDDAGVFLVTEPQLEQCSFPTSFVGSLGIRNSGIIKIPLNVVSPFTMLTWFRPALDVSADTISGSTKLYELKRADGYSPIQFRTYLDQPYLTTAGYYGSGNLHYRWTPQRGQWYFITLTIANGRIQQKIYNNEDMGVVWSNARTNENFENYPLQELILTPWGSSLFDELLVLPYAATDEEIKAWYHSNASMYNNADTYITL